MKRTRRRHMMKWGAAIAVVSLLLGLATTVGLAELASRAVGKDALAEERIEGSTPVRFEGQAAARVPLSPASDCSVLVTPRAGREHYASLTAEQWRTLILAAARGEPVYPPEDTGAPPLVRGEVNNATMYRYGWPLRCFYSVTVYAYGGVKTITEGGAEGRGEVIWLPLLVNSVVLAIPWALLSFALPLIGVVRRRSRRRRGRCPACNYDRAGIAKDAVCPECGKAP